MAALEPVLNACMSLQMSTLWHTAPVLLLLALHSPFAASELLPGSQCALCLQAVRQNSDSDDEGFRPGDLSWEAVMASMQQTDALEGPEAEQALRVLVASKKGEKGSRKRKHASKA